MPDKVDTVVGHAGWDIDYLDYAILQVINDIPGCWKKRVHGRIMADPDRYPFVDEVTLQTVGRHLDAMVDQGFVEPEMVSPDELDQQYVTGFELTSAGVDALQEARIGVVEQDVLQIPDMFNGRGEAVEIEQEALVDMLSREFDEADAETLSDLGKTELVVLLATVYFRRQMREMIDGLDQDHIDALAETIQEIPELHDEFQTQGVITALHDQMSDG